MNKTLSFLLLSGLLIVFISSCTDLEIDQYVGDGQIKRIGNKLTNPGFIVDFGKIDLANSYNRKYEIQSYPEIKSYYGFGLSVENKLSDNKLFLNGNISLSLLKENGESLFSCSSPISSLMKSNSPQREKAFLFFFSTCKSVILLHELDFPKPLYLVVDYSPEGMTDFHQGSIIFTAGGNK